METIEIIAIISLIVCIGIGIWMRHSGKPYGVVLFTIHKLSGIVFAILIAITVMDQMNSGDPTVLDAAIIISFVIAIIALLATGAILSIRDADDSARIIHVLSTIVAIVSGGSIVLGFLL